MDLIYNRVTLVVVASRAATVYDEFLTEMQLNPEEAIMFPARFSAACEALKFLRNALDYNHSTNVD